MSRIADLSPEEQRKLLAQFLQKKAKVPKSFPLSYAQKRLWFLNQLVPDSPVYNIPAAVRLSGPLNVAALEGSLNEIVRHHDILRVTFAKTGEEPVQVIAPAGSHKGYPLQVVDLRDVPPDRREIEALRLANEEAQRPFDLAQGPLMRMTLLRLGDEEYIFLLVIHHIISDAWSIAVLFRELEVLYEAFSEGKPSPLPKLPIQYVDFAHWQRQWLEGEEGKDKESALRTQLSYWRQQLSGNLLTLQLPADHPRPAVQTFRGAWRSRMLPKPLTVALKELSQREGVTLFMTTLAAFVTLLTRYTGGEDIIVGAPIAGRTRAETEKLIGLFINTLVLRTDISGNLSFRELLLRIRDVCLGAYAHQDLPFEKLVEELKPERALNHMPLFQVMFTLQNTPLPNLQFKGLISKFLSPEAVHNGTTKVDLALFVEENDQGLIASFEYSTNLFEEATVTRMLGHFQSLLEGIAADPDQRLSTLSLLTEAERHQLLVKWNDTKTDYPRDLCIHQLFEDQVERTPGAIAVVFEDEELTYQELNHRSNQLAHHLRNLGVGPDVLVAICCERSVEMVVGLLGILKAGGAYVPLDPKYPKERLAFMLEDTQAPVMLTQQQLVESLLHQKAYVVCLDTDWEGISREREDNLPSKISIENLAYVIYTSGSTGKPKGVAIPHRGLLNLVFWHQRAFKVTPSDRATQLATTAFDASVWELWPYFTAGASIHLTPTEVLASPAQLRDWLVSKEITVSFLPTPLAERVLPLDWQKDSALRILLTGGDKLHHYPLASLPFEVVNNYGPTENTVVTTSGPVLPNGRADIAPPIGRPIANTRVYLLDRHLQPVPIGMPGELYISGDSLARGYINCPEQTAERFIPNSFSDEPGARLYKTGDLVRYLPDGNIEFMGRNDYQVKIRGFRVELGEIESVLVGHPAVRETVVLAREDIPGEKRLVAYIVLTPEQAPTIDELRRFLLATLPDYMRPAAFVFLETMPLTPNGKVDRHALPAPEGPRPESEAAYVAPRTEIERAIVAVWGEVLHVEKVGLHDNFFDLGGHSLLLFHAHSKLQEIFNKKIQMIDMFKFPTVSTLSEYFSKEQSEPVSLQESKDRAETRRELMQRRQQTR